MTEQEIRTMARRVARRLFMNGAREQADRLVLTADGPPKRDLGGWSKEAAVDQIADVLRSQIGKSK